jgi:hypothetical protein
VSVRDARGDNIIVDSAKPTCGFPVRYGTVLSPTPSIFHSFVPRSVPIIAIIANRVFYLDVPYCMYCMGACV